MSEADGCDGPERGDDGTFQSIGERDPEALDGHEAILAALESLTAEAHRKVTDGRVRDCEKEEVRIKWMRACAYVASEYRKLLAELGELPESEDEAEEAAKKYWQETPPLQR